MDVFRRTNFPQLRVPAPHSSRLRVDRSFSPIAEFAPPAPNTNYGQVFPVLG